MLSVSEALKSVQHGLEGLRAVPEGDMPQDAHARNAECSERLATMAGYLDTALVRTSDLCATLASNSARPTGTARFEDVVPGSEIEDVLVLERTLLDVQSSLARPLHPQLSAALRMPFQAQLQKENITEAAAKETRETQLLSVLLKDAAVREAWQAPSAEAASSELFSTSNTSWLQKVYARRVPAKPGDASADDAAWDAAKEAIVGACRASVFTVFAVDAHDQNTFAADSPALVVQLLDHAAPSTSNLVKHVMSRLTSLPREVDRKELQNDLFSAIWTFRKRPSDEKRDLEAAAAAAADEVGKIVASRTSGIADSAGMREKGMTVAKEMMIQHWLSFPKASQCTDVATHVLAVHSGVFVAKVTLERQGRGWPLAVRMYPHGVEPIALWGDADESVGAMWDAWSTLATRALCFFRDRAHLSTDSHPGPAALSDLLYWLATYVIAPSPTSGAMSGAGANGHPAEPGTLHSVNSNAHEHGGATTPPEPTSRTGARGPSSEGEARPAGAGGGPPTDALSTPSALSGKLLAREVSSGALVPPLWRPYMLPGSVLRALAQRSSTVRAAQAPLHLTEVPVDLR